VIGSQFIEANEPDAGGVSDDVLVHGPCVETACVPGLVDMKKSLAVKDVRVAVCKRCRARAIFGIGSSSQTCCTNMGNSACVL
jgi:hypothetical protein